MLDLDRDVGGTKLALIDAAERLIAERGVDGVSIRSINAAAGQNVASVHYHFATKQSLVAAVVDRRMPVLAARRMRLLDQLELDGVTAHGLANALVTPLREVQGDEPWGDNYVRFLAAIQRAGRPWSDLSAAAFAPQRIRLEALIDATWPQLPVAVRRFRYQVLSENVLLTLADRERSERFFGESADPPHDAAAAALVDLLAGALGAPHRSPESNER